MTVTTYDRDGILSSRDGRPMATSGLLTLAALGPMVGCGSYAAPAPEAPGARYQVVQATRPATAATSGAAAPADDLAKNPFVVWVKKTYPGQAAAIITSYMKQDGKVDPDRDLLRKQAVDQCASELARQVGISLPRGLTARKVANSAQVSGVTEFQGQEIAIRFEFLVSLLPSGFLQIDVPPTSVYAGSANDSFLVELFGGDLRAKAQAEIAKALDVEGPKNARQTPGLTYKKGGVFLIDPGAAFVNMPS
ncbi:MAG: hypothetical protein FJZ01_02250 [Candidatus Sericytochromatia bacterium]|nr:hypothetical protein [Candidatus Tanganyikabacteria bacterium]